MVKKSASDDKIGKNGATANPFINPNGKVHEFNWNEEQKKLYQELEKEYTDNPGE